MSVLNSPLHNSTGILLEKHITVQAAAEVTGYNVQYLRRMLRASKLEGIKVGQVWLIRMASLGAYIKHTECIQDKRCGPKRLDPTNTSDNECGVERELFTNVYTPRLQT